jgi:ketosteroid isomerase-like protein
VQRTFPAFAPKVRADTPFGDAFCDCQRHEMLLRRGTILALTAASGLSQTRRPTGGLMTTMLAPLSSADTAAIASIHPRFRQALLARDFDVLVGLYTDDAVLMPPNHPAVHGRAALKAWMAAFPNVIEFTLTIQRVEGRADLAYVQGSYVMTIHPDGAPAPVTVQGTYIEIRRRQANGEWLLEADIFNSDNA